MTPLNKSKRKRLLRRDVSWLQHAPQHRYGCMSPNSLVKASAKEQYKLGERQGKDASNAPNDGKMGKRSDRRGDIEGKRNAIKGLRAIKKRDLGSQQNLSQQNHLSYYNNDESVVDVPVQRSRANTVLVSSQEEWDIEAILDKRVRKGKNGKLPHSGSSEVELYLGGRV